MLRAIKHLMIRDDGAILAYVAILLPIFFGFIALGLDVAAWHLDKRHTQTMADAAVVAAAVQSRRTKTEDESASESEIDAAALQAATEAAEQNGYDEAAGDTLTLNRPPASGDFVDEESAIEVIVSTPLPLFLASLLIEGERQASSRAVAFADGGDSCLLALNPSDSGTITVAGGASVTLGCGAYANSDDPSALRVVGGGCLEAEDVLVVGGSDGTCINPTPTTDVPPTPDPLGALPEPEFAGCDHNNKINVTGSQSRTFTPGVYCGGVQINSSGAVTFDPGTYIFDRAGITINSGSNVTGDNVFFFFTNTRAADSFDVAAQANVDFSAPSSGPYKGIFFYQDRDTETNVTHNFTGGSTQNIDGIIYAPTVDVAFSGGSEAQESNTFIIADTITFTGQSALSNPDPDNPLIFSPFLIRARLVE